MTDGGDPTGRPETARLEVGRITKAHGLKGEVVVHFVTDRTDERARPGSELFADGEPLEVVAARPHQTKWLIRFARVDTREAADRLRGRTLEAEPLDSADGVFVHELIGRAVVDQHGTDHGAVVAVVENPASDLLELADGRLVPLAFYVDHDDERISVDVPPGLLDELDELAEPS
ncbi:MAG: ribosome maturation factor RimM [Acidimicrobiales bacterium]